MFATMVADLKAGNLPDKDLLRRRFEAGLVKKLAVIRTPSSFWTADPKINPPAKHLLWAAILLQDRENFNVVEAVMASELEELQRARGKPLAGTDLAARMRQLVQEFIRELIELGPDTAFQKQLQIMAAALSSDYQDPSRST